MANSDISTSAHDLHVASCVTVGIIGRSPTEIRASASLKDGVLRVLVAATLKISPRPSVGAVAVNHELHEIGLITCMLTGHTGRTGQLK